MGASPRVWDYVFLSYARVDGQNFAVRLYADLKSCNVDAWLDMYDIPPAQISTIRLTRA